MLAVEGSVLTIKQAARASRTRCAIVGNDTFRSGMMLLIFDRVNGKPVGLRMDGGYGYYTLRKS